MLKRAYISILLGLFFLPSVAQQRFSIATDLSGLHNFTEDQEFWALGQTVFAHFHFTAVDGAYIWASYYTPGKYTNRLVADAKSSSTQPQQIFFDSKAELTIKNISMGWKHYLRGSAYIEKGWSLYGSAGFGLMIARVTNNYSTTIDTSLYNVPSRPVNGSGRFWRLTFDATAGGEVALGADIYIYLEGRAYIPTTEYPSKYLRVNENAPFIGTAHLGVRVLF